MSIFERERTSAEVILYALYLYFLGLSFRSTSKAIQPFGEEGRSHVAIWKWVQRFNPIRLYCCKRVSAFLIDETMLQIGPDQAWLWVAVEPIHKQILGVYISRHRNMIVAESFLISLIKIYGKHIDYSDGGT
jgi:transposase-like protein